MQIAPHSCLFLILSVAAFGCSGDDEKSGGSAAADCSNLGKVADTAHCPQLCAPSDAGFCGNVSAPVDCAELPPGAKLDACGVPLNEPLENGELLPLSRSGNVKEFGGSGPPDLSCLAPAGYPAAPGSSQKVALTGKVKIFSNGCESKNVAIEIWTVVRDGSEREGLPDTMVGSAVTTAADCTVSGESEDNASCNSFDFKRWECRYRYPDVPTETELLVLTKGPDWAPLYEYNVYLSNAAVVDGVYDKDVRALSQSDYGLIPQTALGKAMEPTNGAIGGEVHDCGDVRLTNAVVDVDRARSLTYFTDNEEKPLPDTSAIATSTLGLYTALDVEPGPITVAAAGALDGTLVGIGAFRARIFKGSVTSVTFRGLRPFQLP